MPDALWLVILPVGAVPVVYLLRRVKAGAVLAALVAAALGWMALRLPTGLILNVLGRSIELDRLSQTTLLVLFTSTALLFLIARFSPPFTGAIIHHRAGDKEEKIFYPVGLAALGLFAAASMSQHLAITALLMQAAAILTMFIIQGERLDSTRAALRFLTMLSLALPFFLLAAWQIDQYQLGGGQETANLKQTAFFVSFGFALWLAIVPFHGWLTATAAEASPATAAFVLVAIPTVAFSTLIHLLSDMPRLAGAPLVVQGIIIAGVFTALAGGGLAGVQRGFAQLMGYAALYNLGVTVTLLGLGGRGAVLAILVNLSVRALALALLAAGAAAIRTRYVGDGFAEVRGVARQMPVAVAGLTVGGLTLAGAPLLAGFAPYWQTIRSAAEVNPTWPVLLVVGGLGVSIGYLRGLWAALTPETPATGGHSGRRGPVLQEPRLLLVLTFLLGLAAILLGLFPSLLIEPLQQWTLSLTIPIG